MIRGYAAVKGNLRRPRKGAIVYKRPELAVLFGALEAVPGGALFEGSVSDTAPPDGWQGGLLVKGTFTADPIQQGTSPSMSDPQRLALALLCYLHAFARIPDAAPELLRWRQWAQAWLEHQGDATASEGLKGMLGLEWPYLGFSYLLQAGYQIASGTVLRDLTPTLITQAMTQFIGIANQHVLQITEEALASILEQSRRY